MAVSFIGGGNGSTRRKSQTCRKLLTNFITQCCIEYISPWLHERYSNSQLQWMTIRSRPRRPRQLIYYSNLWQVVCVHFLMADSISLWFYVNKANGKHINISCSCKTKSINIRKKPEDNQDKNNLETKSTVITRRVTRILKKSEVNHGDRKWQAVHVSNKTLTLLLIVK